MKKIKLCLLICFALLTTFMFVGCNDEPYIDPSIINPPVEEDPPVTPPDNPPVTPPDVEVKEVDGSTINIVRINVDTKEYTGSSLNELYTVEVSHDSNYTYIFATVKVVSGYKFNKQVSTYVNGELDNGHVTLNEELTELTYKIKDPNWTPIY